MTSKTNFHAFAVACLALVLFLAGPALLPAQDVPDDDVPDVDLYEDDPWDDDEWDEDRFGLALGAGVVEPDGEGEIYYMAALRIRILDGDDRSRTRRRPGQRVERGDMEAYIEPEVGYWERDEAGLSQSDLLVGVNAVGVVPGRHVDYFFGVGLGVHFFDTEISSGVVGPGLTSDETNIGGNFQVGLDLNFTEAVSVFGAGRFDIIEGVEDNIQGKVYVGLRFNF